MAEPLIDECILEGSPGAISFYAQASGDALFLIPLPETCLVESITVWLSSSGSTEALRQVRSSDGGRNSSGAAGTDDGDSSDGSDPDRALGIDADGDAGADTSVTEGTVGGEAEGVPDILIEASIGDGPMEDVLVPSTSSLFPAARASDGSRMTRFCICLAQTLRMSVISSIDRVTASVTRVAVNGYRLRLTPPAAAVVPLLNACSYLETENRLAEAVESLRLCGLALLQARRAVQASEMFRKAEEFLLQVSPATWETFHEMARLELLAAEALTQHNQLREKLLAYQRAAAYHFYGRSVVPEPSRFADVSSFVLAVHEPLVTLLLSVLGEGVPYAQHAALSGLEFVLDAVGCSIGAQFVPILVAIVRTYPQHLHDPAPHSPSSSASHSIDWLGTGGASGPGPGSAAAAAAPLRGRPTDEHAGAAAAAGWMPADSAEAAREQGALISHYHRMLETCYDLLPYFSAAVMHSVVQAVVLPALVSPHTHPDLLMRMQRLLVLALSRLHNDLPLTPSLLSRLLDCLAAPPSPLRRACEKTWAALLQFQLTHLGSRELPLLMRWLCARLQSGIRRGDAAEQTRLIELLTQVARSWTQRRAPAAGLQLAELARHALQHAAASPAAQLERVRQRPAPRRAAASAASVAAAGAIAGVAPGASAAAVAGASGAGFSAGMAFVQVVPLLAQLLRAMAHELGSATAFAMVWRCFQSVRACIPADLQPDVSRVLLPILEPMYSRCLDSSPSLPQLEMVLAVLDDLPVDRAMSDFLLRFTLAFSQWVPHSVHDQTFAILQRLLALIGPDMDPTTHLPALVGALLDPFTVKSNLQARCVDSLIQCVLAPARPDVDGDSRVYTFLLPLLDLTLFSNAPPEDGADGMDVRRAQLAHDLFVERLLFARACLQRLDVTHRPVLCAYRAELLATCNRLVQSAHSKTRLCAVDILSCLILRLHIERIETGDGVAAEQVAAGSGSIVVGQDSIDDDEDDDAHDDGDHDRDRAVQADSERFEERDDAGAMMPASTRSDPAAAAVDPASLLALQSFFDRALGAAGDAELHQAALWLLRPVLRTLPTPAAALLVDRLWGHLEAAVQSTWRSVQAVALWVVDACVDMDIAPKLPALLLLMMSASVRDTRLGCVQLAATALRCFGGPEVCRRLGPAVVELLLEACEDPSELVAQAATEWALWLQDSLTGQAEFAASAESSVGGLLQVPQPPQKLWDASLPELEDIEPLEDMVEGEDAASSGPDNLTLDDLGIVDVDDDELDLEDITLGPRRGRPPAARGRSAHIVDEVDALETGGLERAAGPRLGLRGDSPLPGASRSASDPAATTATGEAGGSGARDDDAASPDDSLRVVYVPRRAHTSARSAGAARLVRIAKWRSWTRGVSPRSLLTADSSSDGEAEYLYVDGGAVDVLAEGTSDETRDDTGGLPRGKIVRLRYSADRRRSADPTEAAPASRDRVALVLGNTPLFRVRRVATGSAAVADSSTSRRSGSAGSGSVSGGLGRGDTRRRTRPLSALPPRHESGLGHAAGPVRAVPVSAGGLRTTAPRALASSPPALTAFDRAAVGSGTATAAAAAAAALDPRPAVLAASAVRAADDTRRAGVHGPADIGEATARPSEFERVTALLVALQTAPVATAVEGRTEVVDAASAGEDRGHSERFVSSPLPRESQTVSFQLDPLAAPLSAADLSADALATPPSGGPRRRPKSAPAAPLRSVSLAAGSSEQGREAMLAFDDESGDAAVYAEEPHTTGPGADVDAAASCADADRSGEQDSAQDSEQGGSLCEAADVLLHIADEHSGETDTHTDGC